MPEVTLRDFSGGLVDYFSPTDISDKQFQVFTGLENERLGRLELLKIPKNVASDIEESSAQSYTGGYGFFIYKTDRDADGVFNPTTWFIVTSGENTGSEILKILRYDESDGVNGVYENILTHESGVFEGSNGFWSGDVSANGGMQPDFYASRNVLRISDSNFANDHQSKWYGYINQDRLGEGFTYNTSNKFKEPLGSHTVQDWQLIDQKIERPTIFKDAFGYDYANFVANGTTVGHSLGEYDVQMFVSQPAGTLNTSLITDVGSATFNAEDRYSCTFMYENGQESTLGVVSTPNVTDDADDGQIGLSLNAGYVTASTTVCPVIHFTISEDLNKRIKSINIYWKRGDDTSGDWYLVGSLDIKNAFSEQPQATQINNDYNMGHWIPTPDFTKLFHGIALNSGDADTWGTGTDLSTAGSVDNSTVFPYLKGSEPVVWAGNGTTTGTFTDDATVNATEISNAFLCLIKTDTMYCSIYSNEDSNTDINTGAYGDVDVQLSPISYKGENDASPAGEPRTMWGCLTRDTYSSTWFYPNDGLLASTYQSRTGREQDEKLQAIRWKTSTVANNYVFIGNTDTKDEHDQTVREQSKIFYSKGGDDFDIIRSMEFGLNDGDEIISLEYYAGRLYVLKERNIHILNISTDQFYIEKTYRGIGCQYKSASCVTPYGVITSDKRGIYLITEDRHVEISQAIRDRYQSLEIDDPEVNGFINPSVGYDSMRNRIVFIPQSLDDYYYLDDVPPQEPIEVDPLYLYDFDTKSWVTDKYQYEGIEGRRVGVLSNIATGSDGGVYGLSSSWWSGRKNHIIRYNGMVNNGDRDISWALKTKRFDFGSPFRNKKLKKIGITYKSKQEDIDDPSEFVSGITVLIFINGGANPPNYDNPSFSYVLPYSDNISNYLKSIYKIFKTIEITIGGGMLSGSNVESLPIIEDITIEYELMSNPVSA